MTYKLIAIDLDDTLLTSDIRIPPRVRDAIGKAVAKGIYVVLCTGRIYKSSRRFYSDLGLKSLMITTGGAEIYDANGDHVFSHIVDPAVVRRLVDFSVSNGVHFQAYLNGELVYRERNAYADGYEKANDVLGIGMPGLFELPRIETPKVLMIADLTRMDELQIKAQAAFPMMSVRRSKPTYLEFSSLHVNKGGALKFVAEHYGVDRREIIAMGDAEIDIPMIEYAGLGVAVANAAPIARQAAGYICPGNDEGGVADVIEKFILEAQDENQAED